MEIKSKLAQRIIVWKFIWAIFWWIAFFIIPNLLNNANLFLRFWVWLWYITLWVVIWLFWIMSNHPVLKFPMPFRVRWIVLWWWMNFVLALFVYNDLIIVMKGTIFEWYSPFRIIVEWMIFWLIADHFATKIAWEWKELLK